MKKLMTNNQKVRVFVCFQSRSQNEKMLRRETYRNRGKFLALCSLNLTLKTFLNATFYKKQCKLPNKLPNEF